jgi:hypothetical protein
MHPATVARFGIGSFAVALARRITRLLLALPGLLSLPQLAAAHGPDVVTKVVPLGASAVYSRLASTTPARPAQTFYLGYAVTVSNVDDDKLTELRFSGTTTVTEPAEKAVFVSAQGASCTPSAGGTAVDCALGTLLPGKSSPTFYLFFQTPVRATKLPAGDTANCSATDCIGFAGRTSYIDNETYQHGWMPSAESAPWKAAFVPLGPGDPNRVQSAVPPSGLTLYTGDGAVPLANDVVTSQLAVPPGYAAPAGSVPNASIVEVADNLNCTSLFNCFRVDVTLPGTISPYLTVVLRADASNIRSGVKIEGVLVTYDGAPVGDCASPSTPRSDGFPCIAERKAYPNADKHKHQRGRGHEHHGGDALTDLEGDFEWTLINTRNGSYKIF